MIKEDCIFCKIAKGDIPSATIYESNDFKCILDVAPANKGHALIIPKEHSDNIFELDAEMAAKIFSFATVVAKAIKEETGCDSVMIGRAAKGNPWLFADIKEYLKSGNHMERPDINEICAMMLRHARLMIEYKGEFTGIHEMRKHVAWYTQGMKDSAKLRARINTVETYEELEGMITVLRKENDN